MDADGRIPDADITALVAERARRFHDDAPTTAAGGRDPSCLDGVKAGRWRILVGEDAHRLDERVRAAPRRGFTALSFFASFAKEAGWAAGIVTADHVAAGWLICALTTEALTTGNVFVCERFHPSLAGHGGGDCAGRDRRPCGPPRAAAPD